MTVEELKVKFTASTEEFKAKTDEMKQKLSSVQAVSDNMQKTIDRGMKSTSEKTRKLARDLSSVVDKMNDQSEKVKDAAESVDFYSDKMGQLKAKSEAQTAAIEAQKAKVEELKNKYGTVSDIAGKFGSKIPLREQFEEAEKQANLLEEKIREVQNSIASASSDQDLIFVDDELMSVDKAKEKMAELIAKQEEASRKAGEIEEAMSQIGKDDISSDGMKKMKSEIAAAEKELTMLEREANKTNSEIQTTATKAANSYKKLETAGQAFRKLKSKADSMHAQLKKATAITNRFKEKLESIRDNSIKMISNAFKKATSTISSVISKLRKIPSTLKSIGSHAKSSAGHLSKIPASLKKIALAAVGLRLIKSIFGRLRSVVANYISQNEALNARVEGLKNAFGQLLAPAIEIVVSAFEKLMPYLLAIGDAIVEVLTSLSIFSGLKKTSSAIDGVTDSTNALSKAQSELYGFDKITKQSDDKDSSTATPTYKPAELGSIDEIISKITSAINKAMNSIDWDSVKEKAKSFASEVSAAFNQFFNEIDWEAAGKTVGEGLNTVNEAFNTFLKETDFKLIGESLGTAVSTGINTIDWSLIGQNITLGLSSVGKTVQGYVEKMDWSGVAKAINSLFDGIDLDSATTDLANSVNTAIGGLRTTLQGVDWSSVGKTVADAVNGIFKLDWSNIGGLLSDGVSGAFKTLSGAIVNLNWRGLADSLFELVKGIEWGNVADSIFEAIGAALGGIVSFLQQFLSNAWEEVKTYFSQYLNEEGKLDWSGFWNGIDDAFKDIRKWIKKKIFQPFIKGFKKAFGISSPSKEMKKMGGYLIDGLKSGLSNIWEKVKEEFESLLTGIKDWFSEKKSDIQEVWDTAVEGIGTVVVTVKENYEEFKEGLKAKWTTAVSGISDKIASVKEGYEAFKDGLKSTWANAVKGISSFTASVKEGYEEFKGGLKNKWDNAIKGICSFSAKVKEGYDALKESAKTIWSRSVSGIKSFTATVKEGYQSAKESLKTKWSKAVSGIKDVTKYVKAKFNDTNKSLKERWNKVTSGIGTITSTIKFAFNKTREKLDEWFFDQVKDIVFWDSYVFLTLGQKISVFWDEVKKQWGERILTVKVKVEELIADAKSFINKRLIAPINVKLKEKNFSWTLPYLAKGAVVDAPTLAMIGEAGKEAVMPLENNTGWIDELARRISMNINPKNSSVGSSGKTSVVIPIYIGTRKLTDVLIDDINQRTQTTGRCPIRI